MNPLPADSPAPEPAPVPEIPPDGIVTLLKMIGNTTATVDSGVDDATRDRIREVAIDTVAGFAVKKGVDPSKLLLKARSVGQDIASATQKLDRIKLLALDTEGVPPTSHAVPMTNVLRADDPVPSFPQDEMLANAPDPVGMLFRVPRIIEE